MSKHNEPGYHEHILVDSCGNVICDLCNQAVNNDDKIIDEHINKEEHKLLYRERLFQKNNLSSGDNHSLFCHMCSLTIDSSKVTEHIKCEGHRKLLDFMKAIVVKDGGFILLPGTKRNPTSHLQCLACDRTFPYEPEILYRHIRWTRHTRAKSMALQPLNGIFSVENTAELFCKICQAYIENYVEVILDHVDGEAHSEELGKIKLLIKDENIDIKPYLFDPSEDKAKCKRCDIEVPCNLDNLERHIKGKQHRKNEKAK